LITWSTKILALCLCTSLFLIFLSCSKNKEPAPFFDGLFLTYQEVFGSSEKGEDIFWTRKITYHFKQMKDNTFKISEDVKTQRGKRLKKGIKPVPYPGIGTDVIVDERGIVVKGAASVNFFIEGYPSYLWLPYAKRKTGEVIIKVVSKVGKRTRWRGWEVWPVSFGDSKLHVDYYDADTGILVGKQTNEGKVFTMLVDTNLKELKAALHKRNMK